MKRRASRGLLALMLGAFAFMQASVALAFCAADAPVLAQAAGEPSGDCCPPPAPGGAMNANLCTAHCTSDTQTIGLQAVLVGAADAPVLRSPRVVPSTALAWRTQHPPPRAVPARVLYRSLLI